MNTQDIAARFLAACKEECAKAEAEQRENTINRDRYRALEAEIMRKERAAWFVTARDKSVNIDRVDSVARCNR